MTNPFQVATPRIFTIPPGANFLARLTETLSQSLGLEDNPAALSEMIVYTPNRRAARGLAEAFHTCAAQMGHAALIAPEIRVLGDLEDDVTIAPKGITELNLGPPLSPAKRRGVLMMLIQKWRNEAEKSPFPPASTLAIADELSRLLDQAAMGENVDWSKLPDIVDDKELAEHWQKSVAFLSIISEMWPKFLEEEGATDPMARRVAAAQALAQNWSVQPPEAPVIVMGSTGATPATRILMRAVLDLPKGLVVLPGLDPDLNDTAWTAIKATPSHPQFAMNRALDRLDIDRTQVHPWPDLDEIGPQLARRRLINEALAPATTTKDWTSRLQELAPNGDTLELVQNALVGLHLVEAEDESEEALAAALLLREALETPGKTAALVTPDAGLARRVSALLKQWDVSLSPSAGEPFIRTGQGALFALAFEWLQDMADPVRVLALLKHPLVRLARSDDAYTDALSALEGHKDDFREKNVLRGVRKHTDIDDLADRFARFDRHTAAQLIRDLATAARQADFRLSKAEVDGAQIAESLARFCEALAETPDQPGADIMWRGAKGAEAARYLETLAGISEHIDPPPADLWPEFALAIADGIMVAPQTIDHPRLSILGPLEARLQSHDLVILGSLNENAWPAPAPADSFVPRRVRQELGLPDPEERIGLSAHDFAQLACSPDVVLLRTKRVDDKPSVASRWIWRLRTLASGGLGGLDETDAALRFPPAQDPLIWAKQLHASPDPITRNAPAPKPPVNARPTKFSVSRVANLIRDPYAVYAKDVLRLSPLPAVGEKASFAERGTAIHDAVEAFEKAEGAEDLSDLMSIQLLQMGFSQSDVQLQKPLWSRTAQAYLNWRSKRSDRVQAHWEEIEGGVSVELSGREFRLTAKADRIEHLTNNTFAVVDFKTGAGKTKDQVTSGLEPQLSLEAAIAVRGGFREIPALETSELIYVSLSPGASAISGKNGQPLDINVMEVAQDAFDGFVAMIKAYSNPTQPYLSKPRAEFTWSVSDYDRLARRAEWTSDEGDAA